MKEPFDRKDPIVAKIREISRDSELRVAASVIVAKSLHGSPSVYINALGDKLIERVDVEWPSSMSDSEKELNDVRVAMAGPAYLMKEKYQLNSEEISKALRESDFPEKDLERVKDFFPNGISGNLNAIQIIEEVNEIAFENESIVIPLYEEICHWLISWGEMDLTDEGINELIEELEEEEREYRAITKQED